MVTLGLGLAACLSGCSEKPPPAMTSSATGSATASASATTTVSASSAPSLPSTASAPPSLPTLPAGAHEMTNESAVAYVYYWFDLANYAQLTGDTTPMLAESDERRTICEDLGRQITESYADGGRVTDNLWTLHDVSVVTRKNHAFGVQFSFDQTAGLELDAAGRVRRTLPETHETRVAVLVYLDGAWRMGEIGSA